MTPPELLITISAITAAVVSIINAIAAGWGRKIIEQKASEVKSELVTRSIQVDNKLSEIHKLADGNLSLLQTQLVEAFERITKLETLLARSIDRRKDIIGSLPDPDKQ